jgi:hypothetical protein
LDHLIVWSSKEKQAGPDIGFLRLPLLDSSTHEATNNFANLPKRKQEWSDEPRSPSFHAVVGQVAEWVEDLEPVRSNTRLKGFQLLFGAGNLENRYYSGAYDLCRFTPVYDADHKPPMSYGGVSGGGLWRSYFDIGPDGSTVRAGIALDGCGLL